MACSAPILKTKSWRRNTPHRPDVLVERRARYVGGAKGSNALTQHSEHHSVALVGCCGGLHSATAMDDDGMQ
jgi:hypothetical protein